MINPRPRTLFVIAYLGRWSFWMPFFFESCQRNPGIDWLLFKLVGKFNLWRRCRAFAEVVSTRDGVIQRHGGNYIFSANWLRKNGRPTNNGDGDRSFPYFHFVFWMRNEWSRLHKPDTRAVLALPSEPSRIIDATGFHRG
ncbi:hypothetical protein AAGV37_20355 [Pseudomonas protegens]|uniref:hypothetical protein n=1 Tax=Pseudomonas protegens TaxID=380021 RepID=UPI003159111B